ETLTAINNRVYELDPEMLVIADATRPVGLAGVMGGLETEIGFDTTNVLIEAAQFDAMSVRRTSRALGLFSPSSFRFERPLDPEITDWASRRCAELILEVAGGTLHPGVIDVGGPPPERGPITLRLDQIEEVARIHGYHQIPEDRAVPVTSAPRGLRERVESEVRGLLTGLGLNEAVTFSLVDEALSLPVGPGSGPPPLRIEHSSRKREVALRQSLI